MLTQLNMELGSGSKSWSNLAAHTMLEPVAVDILVGGSRATSRMTNKVSISGMGMLMTRKSLFAQPYRVSSFFILTIKRLFGGTRCPFGGISLWGERFPPKQPF